MRWVVTGLIIGFGGAFAYLIFGDPFAPGIDTPRRLGQIAGRALTPLLLGVALAWLFGKIRGGEPGALHRRANWIAAIILVLATAGTVSNVVK